MKNPAIAILTLLAFCCLLSAGASHAGVQEGRNYLFTRDIDGSLTQANLLLANEEFKNAVAASPNDASANLFYAATRIPALINDNDYDDENGAIENVNELLDLFDFAEAGRSVFRWTADVPRDVNGLALLPPNSPMGDDVQGLLTSILLPEINNALGNLSKIGEDFTLTLTKVETQELYDIEVDYGDVLLFKSALQAAKAVIKFLTAYDLAFDIDFIVELANSGDFGFNRDLFAVYEDLLSLLPGGPDLMDDARELVLTAINTYTQAHNFIIAENDLQYNDLFSFDEDDEIYETSSASFSVVGGALQCNLPNPDPYHWDCQNWNVTVLLSTAGDLNVSGTFCSPEGGQPGTITGTLTQSNGSNNGGDITIEDFAGTWSGAFSFVIGNDSGTGGAEFTVNSDGSGSILFDPYTASEDPEDFLAGLEKVKTSINSQQAVAMGDDEEDDFWVDFSEFFDDPLVLRDHVPSTLGIDPYTKDLVGDLTFPDKTFSGIFPEGVFQKEIVTGVVWGLPEAAGGQGAVVALAWIDGIAPWDINYFTCEGPQNYFWFDPESSFVGSYKFGTIYRTGSIPLSEESNGWFEYYLADSLGEEHEIEKHFTYNELPAVDMQAGGVSPANGAYVNTTTPGFVWNAVTDETIDTLYYRVEVHEISSGTPCYVSDHTSAASHTIPPGYLAPDVSYRWHILTLDGLNGLLSNNRSLSDWGYFHTGADGQPLTVENAFAMHRHRPLDSRNETKFGIRVNGPAVWDVRITVSGPNEYSKIIADGGSFDGETWYENGSYDYRENAYLDDGTYTIQVEDLRSGGGTASANKELAINELPVPATYHAPDDQIYIETTTPTFSWPAVVDEIAAPVYYRITVFEANGDLMYYGSPLSVETYAAMPSGILKPNNPYMWRVEVFDGNSFSQSKNRSRGPVRSFFVKDTFSKYSLDINAGSNGTVLADPSSGPYDVGTEVQLTAVPAEGYFFSAWSGDLTGSDNPAVLVMSKDMTVNAAFEAIADTDGDGVPDHVELASGCMDPNDADTDDDGIPDGVEDANKNGTVDAAETDPCNADTDGDGIQDGTELGYTLSEVGPDTNQGIFVPDQDPTTTTNPLSDDSDNDGIPDGVEDADHNGRVDPGETDPNKAKLKAMPFIPILLTDE